MESITGNLPLPATSHGGISRMSYPASTQPRRPAPFPAITSWSVTGWIMTAPLLAWQPSGPVDREGLLWVFMSGAEMSRGLPTAIHMSGRSWDIIPTVGPHSDYSYMTKLALYLGMAAAEVSYPRGLLASIMQYLLPQPILCILHQIHIPLVQGISLSHGNIGQARHGLREENQLMTFILP